MDKKDMKNDETEFEYTKENHAEETQIVEEEENHKDKISKLKAKLKNCEEEKRNHLEDLQRAKADFLNSRKRVTEQSKVEIENALNGFLISLLPLMDSFDMAISDTETWESVNEDWRKGVEGIKNQLFSIFKKFNVEEIPALGEQFDPNRHEAMSVEDKGKDSDTVIEIIQKGYIRNGNIIRPTKVIIQS